MNLSTTDYLTALGDRLQQPLPGREAQMQMAAYTGRLSFDAPPDAVRAGVLLLIHQQEAEFATILIQRVSHLRDKHSGQISLPGGKLDICDLNIEACALREAQEEIGIDRQEVRVIGKLTDLYIPVSGFLVTPVVGVTGQLPDLKPQPDEVADILQVPLSLLFSESIKGRRDIPLKGGMVLPNVPHFYLNERVVWGATAMMLNEFIIISKEIINPKKRLPQ